MDRQNPDIVVDLGHLSEYTSGDRALEAEFFDLFLTNGKRYLAGLSAASNLAAWRETAHALKGSARGIGAVAVARLSEAAEALPAMPPDGERVRVVAALGAALAAVEAFAESRARNSDGSAAAT